MSKWRAVTSNIPQGMTVFNILLRHLGSEIECSLSRLANHTELSGAVDTGKGRDAIQRDHDKLER